MSWAGAHHAETGPEGVHVPRVADEDQNHHPLDQVLDRGLVAAEPSFKHTAHQRGDKLLHARKNTHSCSPGVYLLCDREAIFLPLWVWAAAAAASATLCFWCDVAGSCYSNALLTLICHYPGEIMKNVVEHCLNSCNWCSANYFDEKRITVLGVIENVTKQNKHLLPHMNTVQTNHILLSNQSLGSCL